LPITRRARLHVSQGAVTELGEHPRGAADEHGLLAGPDQGRGQLLQQPRVARQAEHVVHAVRFAPGEDRFPAEPAVGAEHDPRLRAAAAERRDDFFQGRDRAVARVAVGRAQLRPDRRVADKRIQRQITMAVVVAVEERALLPAVERIVRGVEVEDDLALAAAQRAHTKLEQECFPPRGLRRDLVITARRPVRRDLQPVQRRSGGQRVRRPEFARRRSEERIVPQVLVVVEILIPERQPEDPLRHQLRHRVHDQVRGAPVGEARRHAPGQPQPAIEFAQEQHPAVAAELAAAEVGHHLARSQRRKLERAPLTLCRRPGVSLCHVGLFRANNLSSYHARPFSGL
jgi:hypothetical protein